MRDRFRYEYGAQPLHLIAVVSSLLLCGYALLRITEIPGGGRVLIWIVAAALLHDLVALPLYSGLSRITHGAAAKTIPDRAAMLMALNHVRIPAGLSLLMLVVYAPLILRFDGDRYMDTTGLSVDGYLGKWLLLSAAFFLISGIVYAVRLRRSADADTDIAASPAPAPDGDQPVPSFVRVGGWFVLALTGLVTCWVIATVVVGLVTNGFGL